MNIEKLNKRIEELRQELKEVFEKRGSFVDDEVLEKSQQLDRLLVEYEKLIEKKNKE